MNLGKATTEELLAELNRRTEQPARVKKWCDECQHFVGWKGDPDKTPSDYNPCGKGHKTKFAIPESRNPYDQWGFYRINCEDYP